MVTTQKASNWISAQTWLERLLGMSQRHHLIILSMRFTRRTVCGGSTKTSHYRRWCHHATDSRTSKTWLYLLLEHRIWGCIFIPSTVSGKKVLKKKRKFIFFFWMTFSFVFESTLCRQTITTHFILLCDTAVPA